eukprot:m.98880 g.98880  ORF g.98880 m.98880 type:complete len:81 (-) comp8704_c0_seq2:2485-2727(-)
MLRQCARVVAHAHGEAAARRWMSSVVMFKDENLIAISKRPGLSTQVATAAWDAAAGDASCLWCLHSAIHCVCSSLLVAIR